MRMLLFCCAALAAATIGCTPSVKMATPAGFAQLEDQESYRYRAANAQGVVLAVRSEANAPYGDLGFWSGALDAHLKRQGYRAAKAVDVESADGVRGRQLRYRVDRGGRSHELWVTVFVTDDQVVTVEAGGDEAFFEGAEDDVSRAIRSLTIG